MRQSPTLTGTRVRSTSDAQVIFHAVWLRILPMINKRLNNDERRDIRSGSVYVWEERSTTTDSMGMGGIERWTDSRSWGPSRVRDEFLFYQEKPRSPVDLEMASDSDTTLSSQESTPRARRSTLVKQTYSVLVQTPRGRKKWHLTAYFTQDSLQSLHTIDEFPHLASLHVPPGKYASARSTNRGIRIGAPAQQAPGYQNIPRIFNITTPEPLWNCNANRRGSLAPLAYLQKIAPLRRHPLDEKALMSFSCGDL